MAVNWLKQMAASAPAPVFAAVGPGCLAATERLLADPSLARTTSPRHAGVLLVAGDIPGHDAVALDRVHDQIPPPRGAVQWDGAAAGARAGIIDRWRALCMGAEGDGDHLPDEPPNAWRGTGDHGQGGEGMMGGVPYGRSMAMTGEDVRDGLQLDRYTARFGPFAPMLPPGLVLQVTLQGDLIVACTVVSPPYAQPAAADAPALCAARMLRLLGLRMLADRAVRGRRVRGFGAWRAVPEGLGRLDGSGDARTRLRAWLAGEANFGATGIFSGLVGLEWSEATLVLASVSPSALYCAATAAGGP